MRRRKGISALPFLSPVCGPLALARRMRALCSMLIVATAAVSLASQLPSQPSSQYGKTTGTRRCVAPDTQLLMRLRGGVRTLAEGEWEALHEEAGDKLVVVGALRRDQHACEQAQTADSRCHVVAQISRPSGAGRARRLRPHLRRSPRSTAIPQSSSRRAPMP